MTGSRTQLYNGIILLFTFFSSRLVYGNYQAFRVFRDIWAAVDAHPSLDKSQSSVMAFATESSTVPVWLAAAYLASNLTLNGLNFYWFVMMIRAVRKRFVPTNGFVTEKPTIAEKEPVTEVGVNPSTVGSGLSTPTAPRRRKA